MDHSSIRFVEPYRKSEVNIVDQRQSIVAPTWPLIFLSPVRCSARRPIKILRGGTSWGGTVVRFLVPSFTSAEDSKGIGKRNRRWGDGAFFL